MTAVPVNSINLADFDFAVGRTKVAPEEPHDVSVTIRLPGKDRKTANHELVFHPYFKKYKVKFKTVAIGRAKKRKHPPIIVFDQQTLGQENAIIRKYQKIGGIVNSKGHTLKILGIFKIPIPAESDDVLKVYFKLHPTEVNQNKFNYRICTVSLIKIIKPNRDKDAPRRRVGNRKLTGNRVSKEPPAPEKKDVPSANIL